MPTLINLYGGPGTGKSTTAAHLFALMKQDGYEVELAREYAKELVWSGRHDELMEHQTYVFAKQLKLTHELMNHPLDAVITDSPLLLASVYGGQRQPNAYHTLVQWWVNYWANQSLHIFLAREKPYKQLGRNETQEEARALDSRIRRRMHDWGIIYWSEVADTEAAERIYKGWLDARTLAGVGDGRA